MSFEPMKDNEDTGDVAARAFQLTGTPDPTAAEVLPFEENYVHPDDSARSAAAPAKAGGEL